MGEKNIQVEIKDAKREIWGAFSLANMHDVNFAYQIYSYIKEQPESMQSDLVQYVCELWGMVESSDEASVEEKISKTHLEHMRRLYGDFVDAMLVSLINKGLEENWDRPTFYKNLWKAISTNGMWENDVERAFALYYIAIDSRSPYFNVGTGMKMTNERFNQLIGETSEAGRELQFVLALNSQTKTEEASLVYNILEKMDTDEKKVIFLVRLITYFKIRIERIREQER